MDNTRYKKPGTAVARPNGRSQTRTAGKLTGRKNSRVACDGSALLSITERNTSRGRQNDTTLTSTNKPPALRTSDLLVNQPVAKKDGFFTHKRGQGSYGAGPRADSNDPNKSLREQKKTMEQLAKEGAAQAMASGNLDTEEDGASELTFKNDTTAMSDMNSLQNFSYYGRRFQDRNHRQQESPLASDAASMYNPKNVAAPTNFAAQQNNKIVRKGSNLGNTSAGTMSENVSSLTGFYKGGAPQAEYQLEEKMNDNLMKQFQPMFSEEKDRPQENQLINSISDFSQLNMTNEGTKSRAQLFKQAKETLESQKKMQSASKTQTGFGQQRTRSTQRADSGSRIQTSNMTKTAQNFMPRKTAAKVLPPKLPPRATKSPAVSGLKSKNLVAKQQNLVASQTAMVKPQLESPLNDNIYFAHNNKANNPGVQMQPPKQQQPREITTPKTEVLYKRGARSISKRRDSGVKNLINQGLTEQAIQRKEIDQAYTSGSKRNLLVSDSKVSIGQNSERRREAHLGTCQACQDKEMDGHDHSVSHSLERRLHKFNQNFNQTGHCKLHNVIGCERCSFGSSKGSRVSSLESANLLSADVLRKHKIAPRSDIGGPLNKSKIARSVTRKMSRGKNMTGVRNSLQQSINQTLNPQNSSDQVGRIRSLPRGNDDDQDDSDLINRFADDRRSTKNAEVRNMTNQLMAFGKKGNRPKHVPKPSNFAISEVKVNVSGRQDTRNDSSNSRGYSEIAGVKKIPQFSRILSAKTSSIERQTLQNNLQQKDHDGLIQKDIKKLAADWEGDPNDPAFWKRLENENSQTKLRKKEQLRADEAKSKQLSVLGKQSDVFRQLRETDEVTSARGSQIGGFGHKGSTGPSRQMMDLTRRSNQSFFNNTIMQGGGMDEPIQTEMDETEYKDLPNFDASKKFLHQDPSRAVLTDYDIADEVGQTGFMNSIRHQIDFMDKDQVDKVLLDTNIEDLRNQQRKLQESRPARQVDDMSMKHQMFSGQTVKTAVVSSPMNMGDIASAQQQQTALIEDNITGGFPSETRDEAASKVNSGSGQPTTKFENQDKDSEDADSFDEEKQKTQVLKELEDADGEEKISEKSNEEDEAERVRKKEINEKTMANVKSYDDYLEDLTQKEIERQSQMNHGSPKNYYQKDDIKLGEVSLTQTRKSFDRLEDNNTIEDETGIAESVRDQNLKNPRPKTRGEPMIKNFDHQQPTGELSSKNQFSARRKTHDTSDTGTKKHLHSSSFEPNSTQKPGQSPLMTTNQSQLTKSPDKRTLGFGGPSKIISETGGKSFTNFASSLKDDDLMISSSQVDPMEIKSVRANSKLGASSKTKGGLTANLVNTASMDQLAIEEESSSLKSVSPLTENSLSKKSHQISAQSLIQSPPQMVSEKKLSDFNRAPLPPKDSRPPKSPFGISSKKAQIIEQKPQPQPTKEIAQESDKIKENYISFAPDQSQLQQTVQKPEVSATKKQDFSDAKPEIGQRNPAVQAFLDFEDSDDDDFSMVIQKKPSVQNPYAPVQQQQPQPQPQPQQQPQPQPQPQPQQQPQSQPKQQEEKDIQDEIIKLSPVKRQNLAKTPSAQFVPNAQFVKSNPHQMPQLTPLAQMSVPMAKTPNTGVSSKKIKAMQVESKMATAQVPPHVLPRTASIDNEPSVNEQIDRIDYNMSNDGMSASFYRHQDQWQAQQQTQVQHKTLRSGLSSRDTNRQLVNKTVDVTQSQQLQPEMQLKQQVSKIVNEATEANQKVQELRKSVQALPPQHPQMAIGKDNEVRQSGTGTAGYSRPQGSVKKALNQTSRTSLSIRDDSQDKVGGVKEDATDKFVRSNSNRRTPNFRPNNSTMSSDQKGATQGSSGKKKEQFFSKHKDSISSNVVKAAGGKKREPSEARQASRDRLYNQETIASILKRNPELGYNAKDKKPPAAPPRKIKKKPVPLPPPEPPKPDPPEEPLPQSPRVLQLPVEASLPNPESAPTTLPLPMRFPEDPPTEPSTIIMPNLFCPADPDTPYNYEIEPREEEFHFAPFEPVPLSQAFEPPEPEYPERMIKTQQTEELYAEKLEEDELFCKPVEPIHDDEPMLEYPRQMQQFMLPPEQPAKFEECKTIYPDEPICEPLPDKEDDLPTPKEPATQFITHDSLFKTNEMSIQCDNPAEEAKEESKQHLTTIEEEASDEDNFSVHSCEMVNKVTVGIQTNEAHFRNVARTEEFARKKNERMESLDWALSPLFDEIEFAKEKKTIGGRKMVSSIGTQMEQHENCGNQVEEAQIIQETAVQILSQIECEYNVDQLKRKMVGKDAVVDDRCSELYSFGLNTLKALMLGLRLEKEWEFQTKNQYTALGEVSDPDETIKLLTRCKKMYEAKTLIQRLLKMIVQRNQMVEEATKLEELPDTRGGTSMNIPTRKAQPKISKESMAQIKRLSTRVTSQINTLQEEHRIFKRPFILKGQEYLQQVQSEGDMLEELMTKKFFVDERGTTGDAMSDSMKSASQQ